jgi:hypothetical protein
VFFGRHAGQTRVCLEVEFWGPVRGSPGGPNFKLIRGGLTVGPPAFGPKWGSPGGPQTGVKNRLQNGFDGNEYFGHGATGGEPNGPDKVIRLFGFEQKNATLSMATFLWCPAFLSESIASFGEGLMDFFPMHAVQNHVDMNEL